MKKLISILIFAILFGNYAMAYDFSTVCESGQTLYYNITSNVEPYTVEVVSQNSSYPYYDTAPFGILEIPETVEYNSLTYSVTSIGEWAFSYCSGLTTVTIGNSVTSIGEGAFSYCSGIETMIVESGNPIYDSRNNCNAIIETSSNNLLFGCENTIIPESVITIGDYAFEGCSALTSVTIPNSVTSIGNYAFSGCSGLTSVAIGNSVTSIGSGAFEGCSALTSVTIPNSVTSIGNYAFEGCSGLTSVAIGNSVASIGEWAFSYCSGLTSVTIPNSVTSIGGGAFSGCSGLTSVTIPNSVTSIGEMAFSGCSGLTSVAIGNSVTSIGSGAFEGCSALTSVTIPNSVTSIGNYAFHGTGWYNNQPDGILYLGDWCIGYKGDSPTGELTITEGARGIADYAFSHCSGLTSITIPNSVTSIGERAFSDCSSIETMIVESGNHIYDSRNNCNAIIETSTNTLILGCKNTIIPNSVTSIGQNAFYGCSGLTGDLTIPSSVTSIGEMAFSGCSGLTSVFIGNSVRTINSGAFWECTSLTEIYLGNSVETIGGGAFWCVDALFKSSIGTIFVLGETPPTLSHGEDFDGFGVFPEEPYSENSFRRLVVCCGNRGAYEASDWAQYFTTIEEDCNRYNISSNSNTVQGGSFNISSTEARMGEEVLVYVTVDEGYEIDHIIAFNADNPNEIVPITRTNNRYVITYSMIMPAFAVKIEAGFREVTGIEENATLEISLFPNPATDILNISSSETISEIEIVNTLGQVVKRIEVNADNAVCNVEELPNGFYVVRIYNEDTKSFCQKKFAKE